MSLWLYVPGYGQCLATCTEEHVHLDDQAGRAECHDLQCQGDHQHCNLEGHMPGMGPRTKYMEDYQPGLASTLAAAISLDEPPQQWEAGYTTSEQKLVTGNLLKLRTSVKQDAFRSVQKLHRNLGHPAPKELEELLAARGASDQVLEAARTYVCVACAKYKKPADAAPAAMPTTATFNQTVQADVFWLRRGTTKFPIVSMVDVATRFTVAMLLHNEQSEELVKAFQRGWLAMFGPPQHLITDEGRGWLSREFEEWTAGHDIFHEVAPGEAHERLSIVERRPAVLRKALEVYCDEYKHFNAAGIKEALVYVVPQLNAVTSVSGFSPSQWVLGYQPQLSGSLLTERLNPAQFGGHEDFEINLARRSTAQKAMIEADADRRLRRALGAKYRGLNAEYSLGQKVWFWRDARQPDLVKIRWLGPAQVVMKERKADSEGQQRVHVYWLAYKTQLIRCAPHHVRADIKSIGHALDDAQQALSTVQQLRSRGVTRYYDLHHLNKRTLAEIESDDQHDDPDGDVMEDSDHEMAPPRQRPRLLLPDAPQPDAPEAPPPVAAGEYTPTSPANSAVAQLAEQMAEQQAAQAEQNTTTSTAAAADTNNPGATATDPEMLPRVPSELDPVSEPSEEPPAQSAQPTPHASRPLAEERPQLDPATAALYEPQQAETFTQRRARLNRQETLSFAPWRTRPAHAAIAPYNAEHSSSAPTPPATDDLAGQAFYLDDLDTKTLPTGWKMDEREFLQLNDKEADYWEIRAGCLIRHHCVPRRGRLPLAQLPKDCPVDATKLDPIRVTLIHQPGGKSRLFTDDGNEHSPPPLVNGTWTGATIYQLNGDTRQELALSHRN